jgi:hypothetical protein
MKRHLRRYWNKFLNFIISNRRQKILIKMVRDAERLGLYDDNGKEK